MSMARSTPAQKPRGLARMIFITLRLLAISYQPSALQKQRHHTSHEPSTSTELGIPKGFRLSTKNQLNPSPHSILPPPLIIPLIFNCASDGRETLEGSAAWVRSGLRRSGGAPPGVRRRKAGTDHRTVEGTRCYLGATGPRARRREYQKDSASDRRGRGAAVGAGATSPCRTPSPLVSPASPPGARQPGRLRHALDTSSLTLYAVVRWELPRPRKS